MAHTVRLPRKVLTPHYPKRCVACWTDGPAEWFTRTERVGFWLRSEEFSAAAPCCSNCAPMLKRGRLWRQALLWIGVAAGALLAWRTFGPSGWHPIDLAHSRGGRKLVAIGGAAAGAVPYGIVMWSCPLAFDISASKDSVAYEFADRAFAEEFAALNGGHVT